MRLQQLLWNPQRVSSFAVVLLFGVTLSASYAVAASTDPGTKSSAEPSKKAIEDTFITAVENVAQAVGPAVVSINSEEIQDYRAKFSGDPFEDEFLKYFFEDFLGATPEKQFKRWGFGSGVIIDKEGYILTNEHVVRNAKHIMVTLADGREFKADLQGTDPRSDLAVIKITAPDLPVAQLGDSDRLKAGQWVVAIGNPFGNLISNPEPTVTTGVISALHRSLPRTSQRDTDYTDLIQTDAAINPGNSGGPLVSLQGEIIAINVAIFSTTGGYQGIGFAIPINNAKRIIEQLIKGKKISYGWMGVSVQGIDQRLAKYFELPDTSGVLISHVLTSGPAEKAGLKSGDIVLAMNGIGVQDVSDLLKKVGNSPINEKIVLKILRNKNEIKVPVVIEERPNFDSDTAVPEPDNPEEKQEANASNQWRGITARNITYEIRTHLSDRTIEGVIVSQVEYNSPAHDAGIREGDILGAVNNITVRSVQDFARITRQIKGDCLIRTNRGYFVLKE